MSYLVTLLVLPVVASKSGRPRTQVPSATFVNYDQYTTAKTPTEEPQSHEVMLMEVEKLEPIALENQEGMFYIGLSSQHGPDFFLKSYILFAVLC